jgi:hypothetical protein
MKYVSYLSISRQPSLYLKYRAQFDVDLVWVGKPSISVPRKSFGLHYSLVKLISCQLFDLQAAYLNSVRDCFSLGYCFLLNCIICTANIVSDACSFLVPLASPPISGRGDKKEEGRNVEGTFLSNTPSKPPESTALRLNSRTDRS